MPDSVVGRKRAAAGPPVKTKAEKRAEAKAAKARARARRRRRELMTVAGAAVVVLALVVGLVVWIGGSSPESNYATADGVASSAATASPVPSAAAPSIPAALRKKPVATAGTGAVRKLTVTTLVKGTGPAVESGQTIEVNYVGVTYAEGKEFDSSWKRSQPFSFRIGAGSVIPGWDQGLVGVKVGSRVRLDIPAAMAYGEHPSGPQPAGPLRFVVDVLSAS
ncbi:FKBP-type peptidyl-prolyl cis-trans isomerase [Actinoplanes oblitus]|uniref:Peptidyl-prolyl cis-trans isomerase n=1 Tax=Actinoplanes oblitus TaxID=3040509 RepID=A0ABY8WSK3_9ACTN|nr:FKBP-type peptidyl-prolyl cis-trans isomerase [Actinoplanes oblitus]WIN00443.1 FKBP-type peptidyl-prolyl cis-trans isomerase [Actinoplanes oblitus]